ncbi:MAG: sulfatase-like hydrolase/transferase [Planctomycetes bacterium]|nr:sulfatase-like hydrolase/transferase [Planctomycetota bacterium]
MTTRREFLRAGAAAMLAPAMLRRSPKRPPNFVVIVSDQLGLDAISAHGCPDVRTPNIDRLIRRGTTFLESHSTNPVCSPARSSIFTGRMTAETGVISNNRPIHPSVPDMGEWFRRAGYETIHCGKWHLPEGYPVRMKGFGVLPVGGGQGDICDALVSRSCEAYLKSRSREKPFVLVASFMQPHDICYWAIRGRQLVPEAPPFPQLAGSLPALPPNHGARPPAPAMLDRIAYKGFSDDQWRYYIHVYYRQVEMVDGDIGRLLDAIEDAGEAQDTIVILTADHGEGRGRHMHVQKWYPYEEAVKVPLVIARPGLLPEGARDAAHLVSGVDVLPTMCDLAGIEAPHRTVSRSLRPLLEGKATDWRECVVADMHLRRDGAGNAGHMVRTERFKYVRYDGDPVEQFFDMKADPWETENLHREAKYADVIRDHRELLADWQARLERVPPTPEAGGGARKAAQKTAKTGRGS